MKGKPKLTPLYTLARQVESLIEYSRKSPESRLFLYPIIQNILETKFPTLFENNPDWRYPHTSSLRELATKVNRRIADEKNS